MVACGIVSYRTDLRVSICHCVCIELPTPKLASMSELRELSMKVLRVTRPTELGYTYEELKAMDEISVKTLSEKKGMVFKHVEYAVESKVCMYMCFLSIGVTLILSGNFRASSPGSRGDIETLKHSMTSWWPSIHTDWYLGSHQRN